MRGLVLVLALVALAACEARPGAMSGPTLSLGGSVSALSVTQR
jgi:hypothetical protein